MCLKAILAECGHVTSVEGTSKGNTTDKKCNVLVQRSHGEDGQSGSEGSEDDDYVPYVPVKIRKQQMVSYCLLAS